MKKIHVGLLVDEFFGAWGTAFGGYGFLARKLIAKYLPNEEFEVDVILGKNRNGFLSNFRHSELEVETDGVRTKLYYSPRRRYFTKRWLKKQAYDLFLSIEYGEGSVGKFVNELGIPLLVWIQDPRPWSDWREIQSAKLLQETVYYSQKTYDELHELFLKGYVHFVSQAECLVEKARDLYRLLDAAKIDMLRNPIDVDESFDFATCKKKDQILFLGRIESVKRGWLFCEIAKAMPEYTFIMCGQAFRGKEEMSPVMRRYADIPNLKFVGHVDGEVKERYLRESKILVNTSIHEALPVSYLEALANGVCIVSNQNPDNLAGRFGVDVGRVPGDGFDAVDRYVTAIRSLMNDDCLRIEKATAGLAYVKRYHERRMIIDQLRTTIKQVLEVSSGCRSERFAWRSIIKDALMRLF